MPVELSFLKRLDTPQAKQLAKKLPAAWFKGMVREVLKMENVGAGVWTIACVDDPAMTQVHGRSMGLFTTTDVLTFDLRAPLAKRAGLAGAATSLGAGAGPNGGAEVPPSSHIELDTVICLDEAARQADIRGHELNREVLLYSIHSLLHVCGYDDRKTTDARRMHRREDEILVALGVGAVFERPLKR